MQSLLLLDQLPFPCVRQSLQVLLRNPQKRMPIQQRIKFCIYLIVRRQHIIPGAARPRIIALEHVFVPLFMDRINIRSREIVRFQVLQRLRSRFQPRTNKIQPLYHQIVIRIVRKPHSRVRCRHIRRCRSEWEQYAN